MNKIDQFFAAVMGKCVHTWQDVGDWALMKCSKCGEISNSLNDLYGVNQWSPSLNGEISYEVRKWFQEYEPDVWKTYLEKTMYDLKMWPDILNAQLSIQNFYDYLVANWQEWGYHFCTYSVTGCGGCKAGYIEQERNCDGDRYCKYPEAERVLKGEK